VYIYLYIYIYIYSFARDRRAINERQTNDKRERERAKGEGDGRMTATYKDASGVTRACEGGGRAARGSACLMELETELTIPARGP